MIFNSDSLADADMAEGVPKTSSILKIGFLFDHVSETYENESDLNYLFIYFFDVLAWTKFAQVFGSLWHCACWRSNHGYSIENLITYHLKDFGRDVIFFDNLILRNAWISMKTMKTMKRLSRTPGIHLTTINFLEIFIDKNIQKQFLRSFTDIFHSKWIKKM